MSELNIKIEGTNYPTWTDFYLKKSLEEVAHSFSFSVYKSPELQEIKRHDDVKIYFGGNLYTAGRIDNPSHRLSSNNHSYSYTGRSYVRDMIDCSASANYKDKSLDYIFARLCKFFEVPYTLGSGVKTKIVSEFVFTAETPWPKMVSEAINQGLIVTSDRKGGVILEKARSEKIPLVLEEGVNFSDIESNPDGTRQFSHYIINPGDDQVIIRDKTVPCYRPMDIIIDRPMNTEEARQRGETEKKRGQAVPYKVTFKSWKYDEDNYWDVNLLVKTVSPSFSLDKYLLVSQVEFYLKQRSKYVVLTLEDKEVYE